MRDCLRCEYANMCKYDGFCVKVLEKELSLFEWCMVFVFAGLSLSAFLFAMVLFFGF